MFGYGGEGEGEDTNIGNKGETNDWRYESGDGGATQTCLQPFPSVDLVHSRGDSR